MLEVYRQPPASLPNIRPSLHSRCLEMVRFETDRCVNRKRVIVLPSSFEAALESPPGWGKVMRTPLAASWRESYGGHWMERELACR